MTLYLAGHETTALTLTWSWYLIATPPAGGGEARRGMARGAGRAQRRRRTTSPNLPYTDAVITEAMRLYPPVYLIGREATCDLELGGYRVKKGYTIFMSQWVSHRDPRYFPGSRSVSPRALDRRARRSASRSTLTIRSAAARGCASATPSR